MIKYFLSVKCTNELCSSKDVVSSFWYVNETTSHPCGICGQTITFCEVLDEQEFPDPPPPPDIIELGVS